MKKILVVLFSIIMLMTLSIGCGSNDASSSEKVTLTIAGPWEEFAGLETLANDFTKEYPNCEVVYEYMQDFDETLTTRLEGTTDKVDLFLPSNIQKDSAFYPYALDLSKEKELDISDTFEGLLDNAKLQTSNKDEENQFYALPLGAEIRGMYVNKTLLDSLKIDVPTNQKEFLAACKKLKEAGYVPLQGNPGMFGQQLLYPGICNAVANADDYEKTYDMVNSRSEGCTELFEPQMKFLYGLVEKGYYNYKYSEVELNLFNDVSDEGYARSFLNIIDNGNGLEKQDDLGQVAFMPSTQSLTSVIDKVKDDYHSKIEYEFILSPVGKDGGYAYLSPGRSIAVNKNSDNVDWAIKFMNFIFDEDNNTKFAEENNTLPNNENVYDIISEDFNVPETSVSQLGQVTFDYDFFTVINTTLINISKGNNPKYMKINDDGTTQMYLLSHYTDQLQADFDAVE